MYKNAQNLTNLTALEVCSLLSFRGHWKSTIIENHLSFSFIAMCINNTKESMIQIHLFFFFYKLGLSFVLLNRHLSEIISQGYSVYRIAGIWFGVSTESAHIKFVCLLCFPIWIKISSNAFQGKIFICIEIGFLKFFFLSSISFYF